MRTALYVLGLGLSAVGVVAFITALLVPEGVTVAGLARCWFRGRHEPRRAFPDGQRCRDCGAAGADLEEMGFPGGAYVPTTRKLFDRDRRELTRTSAWTQGRSGW